VGHDAGAVGPGEHDSTVDPLGADAFVAQVMMERTQQRQIDH